MPTLVRTDVMQSKASIDTLETKLKAKGFKIEAKLQASTAIWDATDCDAMNDFADDTDEEVWVLVSSKA